VLIGDPGDLECCEGGVEDSDGNCCVGT